MSSDLGDTTLVEAGLAEFDPSRRKGAPRHIDVYLTTCGRPAFLQRSLELVLEACRLSPYSHRVIVMLDRADLDSWKVLERRLGLLHVLSSCHNLGLPFFVNLIHDYQLLLEGRSETKADYLCYLQDDCEIRSAKQYFPLMVESYEHFVGQGEKLGFSSAFYSPLHPGYKKCRFHKYTALLSDSITGLNLFAPVATFHEVGKMTWTLPNGERRGNPGPVKGSHFDLWQWKESPHATSKSGRVNLILPGLAVTMATNAGESTWNNPGEDPEYVARRVRERKIYKTRITPIPTLAPEEFFQPADG